MKKVLFTATVDSHILQFHIPFLKLFKEKGYEVHVATNGKEKIPFCDVKHVISFERSPLKLNNLKAIKQLKKICNEEKFDIIHCHTPMGSVVTRLAAKHSRKKFNTRVIYTAHGFHFFKGASLKNWLIFYPVEKWLAKYTDTLILINKEDYELAKKKFSHRCNDIQYVPGVGINEDKFNFNMNNIDKNKLRQSLGLKSDDFVIIYPAELNKNKNQLLIINAMKCLVKKHNNIKALLPGVDSYNGFYQNIVKKNNLENNIFFLGYRNDIPMLLRISNLAVATSYREGLPLNVMEAMYVGLPIIATNCRGQRDLIKNNINGFLIDVNNVNQFISSIEKILYNDYSDFIKNSKAIIKDYLLDTVISNMEKIYFKKKRIAYLRSNSITNDSRCTKEIQSFINSFNFDVLIFCWDRENVLCNSNNLYNELRNNNSIKFLIYKRKSIYGSGLKNLFKIFLYNIWLFKKLKFYRNDFDTLHSCDFDTGFVTRLFCKKYHKKYIYDIFDYYSDSHNCYFLKKFISKLENSVINESDSTIICNEWRKKQIALAKPKKLYVVHNSPEVNMHDIKSIIKSKSTRMKICYVGILQDDRLLLELLEKFKNNDLFEFHVGGFGKYSDLFKKASLEFSNIYYYGTMDYDSVLCLENDCDILFATYNPIISNHSYSAPNKLYEAMALGKPIIVCNNTGVDTFVKNNRLGYVINYDADEFINLLKSINKRELHSFFESSKKLYNEKYKWNVMFNKLKDRY